MRFLLRPGWIALTLAVAAFAFACAYLLAPWQFHRSTERDGANLALENALSEGPVPRAELVAPGTAPSPAVQWRQVLVTGTYEPSGEVLVRLRSVDGGAAYEVMTPLRATTGETLLVDRGYVRPDSARTVPPIAAAPPGTVTVAGYLHLDETASDRPAIVEGGYRQVYAADAVDVGRATGLTLSPGYVQLLPAQPGVLTPVPLPQLDPNSSYSYAWQWMIFGVMAIGSWIYFVRLEYRTRRGLVARGPRDDDPRDRPATPAVTRPGVTTPDAASLERTDPRDAPVAERTPVGRGAGARSTSETLADRYGRR